MLNQSSALHEPKKHHWLISATLTVATKEGPEEPTQLTSINMNAVIETEQQFLTALDMGRGNQHLQLLFHNRYKPNPELTTVVDIFTVGISHVGFMKPSTFNNLPKREEEPLINPTGTGLGPVEDAEA